MNVVLLDLKTLRCKVKSKKFEIVYGTLITPDSLNKDGEWIKDRVCGSVPMWVNKIEPCVDLLPEIKADLEDLKGSKKKLQYVIYGFIEHENRYLMYFEKKRI